MCKVDGGVYNMDKYPKNVTIKVNDENVNIMKVNNSKFMLLKKN